MVQAGRVLVEQQDRSEYPRQLRFDEAHEICEKYKIDLSIPYAVYRDVLYMTARSLAAPENRSALNKAVSDGDADRAIDRLSGAMVDFEASREVVASAVLSKPIKMSPKVALLGAQSPPIAPGGESQVATNLDPDSPDKHVARAGGRRVP